MNTMEYLRNKKGYKENKKTEKEESSKHEASESKPMEAKEHEIINKISKRKIGMAEHKEYSKGKAT